MARGVVVLANDTDPGGDPVTITAVANPAHGSAAINPGTHSLRYTPDRGY